MHQCTHAMMNLFAGFNSAFGLYQLTGEVKNNVKLVGKAATKREIMSPELWDNHLMGRQGLGIIPINENSQVKFAAIDIDKYDINHHEIQKKINNYSLPLVLCRSKSGGAHLYMFMCDFTDATIVQPKMREMASILGHGTAELYPRQTKVLASRGDMGQWINMPYFNAEETERYAFNNRFEKLTVDKFIDYASSKIVTPSRLDKISAETIAELPGAPPCLQLLVKQGFPDGTRNNGLFNLGVYARKYQPEGWQRQIEEMNGKYMNPPLHSTEVLGVIKSVGRKEYAYTCKQPPIMSFCNQVKCRQCKLGIGAANGMPSMGSLTKVASTPPIWFVEIEGGGRIELTTDELQNPRLFQRRCMDAMNIMPGIPKRENWEDTVRELISDVQIIEMPKDSSPIGRFLEHLETFCSSRVMSYSADGLILGKPFSYDGKVYFRLKDFLSYLDRIKFDELPTNRMVLALRENAKAENKGWNVKGKCIQTWAVAEYAKLEEKIDLPPQLTKPRSTPY